MTDLPYFQVDSTRIFVFGSNEAGRHGKGAALSAKRHFGAIYGQGYGLQGNSFAIPTKSYTLETLPLPDIGIYVRGFLEFAKEHPEMTFRVTPIGCGLAGYNPEDIAPLFEGYPENVNLPQAFLDILKSKLFTTNRVDDLMNTIMKWKGDVGKGWHPIVEKAITEIEDKRGFILQVKEKFGGLRLYSTGGDIDAIDDITREAEQLAAVTCETCGEPGSLRYDKPWLKTLCDKCNSER